MGLKALTEGSLVYLDTCILIYLVEGYPPLQDVLRKLWNETKEEAIGTLTSQLSILETLVLPVREKDEGLVKRYEALYSTSRIVYASISILRHAAHLRARHPSLRTPDAIHLATALEQGCHVFLTHDKRMPSVGNLHIVALADLKAED